MTALVYAARLWLCNRLLDLVEAVLPTEAMSELNRLRRLRLTGWQD